MDRVRCREKAARIGDLLDDFYPLPPIPLLHRDPFTLLVAVVLSAQTTDARVNLVTPELFRLAPDAAALSRLSVEEILEVIRTCGLAPTKARNLKRLSELLLEHHGGAVPADLDALEQLPGVGHKTASVVMVQAFGQPALPVDTHIHRLAARWGLSNGSTVERTERDLKKLFPADQWGRRHLQIIYFGRQHCPARGHDTESCPICSWATATKGRRSSESSAGGAAQRPSKAPASERPGQARGKSP